MRITTLAFVLALLAAPAIAQESTGATELCASAVTYLDGYVGLTADQLRQTLGEPGSESVEHVGEGEREAELWYYNAESSDGERVGWRFAIQHDRVTGAEFFTASEPDCHHAAALEFVESKGSTWTPGLSMYGPTEVARAEDRVWEVGFVEEGDGRSTRTEVGTTKYQMCQVAWDVEGLWGTDGFGNFLAEETPGTDAPEE
jgi:hypothetical protein